MLNPKTATNLVFQVIKIVILIIVLISLLDDTEIHRNTVAEKLSSTPNFTITWNKSDFSGFLHFFCSIPEARSVTVTTDDVDEALNLPNGCRPDSRLYKYGECRAKATKLRANTNDCNCYPDAAFISMIVLATICIVANFASIFLGPFEKASVWTLFATLIVALWFAVSTMAAFNQTFVYHGFATDRDTLAATRYYSPVPFWWMSIAFAYFYCFVGIVEACYFDAAMSTLVIRSTICYGRLQNLHWRKRRVELNALERYGKQREISESRFVAVLVRSNSWP